MSGLELGLGNGNGSLERRISWAPALPPPSHSFTDELAGFYKGHNKFDIDRLTFVSLSQLMKYVLSGDFIFIFSNLNLERSIQYLLDRHPRVCNKVKTHMMGLG